MTRRRGDGGRRKHCGLGERVAAAVGPLRTGRVANEEQGPHQPDKTQRPDNEEPRPHARRQRHPAEQRLHERGGGCGPAADGRADRADEGAAPGLHQLLPGRQPRVAPRDIPPAQFCKLMRSAEAAAGAEAEGERERTVRRAES